MNNREAAQRIFMAGVKSVLPGELIRNVMHLEGSFLFVQEHCIDLNAVSGIYIIGAGKASAAMGHYVEGVLGDRITGGHIVVKYGYSCKLKKIKVTEAGHPVPDENSFRAAEEIVRIAQNAGPNDLVICLISGGGSALMSDLPGGLLPEELYIVNNLLIKCGASIDEINCVRKHLSEIKGGQLARIVYPAKIISVMISDVPGNRIDVIASGPTVADSSTFVDALRIIEKYGLASGLTAGVLNYLHEGAGGGKPETPKPGDPLFNDVINIIAATNLTALEGALGCAETMGFSSRIIDSELQGDVENIAETIVGKTVEYKNDDSMQKPACFLYGGEPTIKVGNEGKGGRNQHLALSAAIRIGNMQGITFLSGGTDGNDGPTDAAGAVVDSGTLIAAGELNIDPLEYLMKFDSYNFFRKTGGHLKTGPTYTNVMDLIIVLVE